MAEPLSAYHSVPAPPSLRRLTAFQWKSDLVDYGAHPAYAPFVGKQGPVARARALAIYLARLTPLLVKRVIHYELIPGEYRNGRSLRSRLGFLWHALRNATPLGREGGGGRGSAATPCAQALDAEGVAVLVMPPERRDALLDMAQPYFAALDERRGRGVNRREFDDSRSTLDRQRAPELFALVERIFAESGLTDAVDAYLGRKARLVDINPQINDPTDSFWRDIFEDRPSGKLPQAAYCHRDASGGDIKVMLYCSDVDAEQGPFNFALGSNTMKISKLDNLLCEANDHNGLSSTAIEARKTFAALPARLRQKGAFGNDLLDDSPASQRIVESLWQITAPAGAIVAFDTKGIHRGGMVRQGERRVLTCVLC